MQRFAVALVLAALAVAFVALAARGARMAWGAVDGAVHGDRSGGALMQRLAFFLLIGLIFYVSVLGGT